MNIFWKKMFGGMTPTHKLEKQEVALREQLQRYFAVENSSELAEFIQLKMTVEKSNFKRKKKILLNRKYKDTKEYRQRNKLNKIERIASFNRYLEIVERGELNNFLAFRENEAYDDLSDKKKVKSSRFLQEMKKHERSKAYKIYLRYHDSFVEQEYLELKNIVSSNEFKERDAFWKNSRRWETTAEYKIDERYYNLKMNPDIQFYCNADSARFEALKKIKVTLDEQFDGNTMNASLWSAGFYYKNDYMLKNHSFVNEKQANNAGGNVSVHNGVLQIKTTEAHVLASAWDVKKGFVEKEFRYLSDAIHSANSFRQKGGCFRAKIRCTGPVQHAFWLAGEHKLPHINVFRFDGKKVTVGNATEKLFDQVEITGFSSSKYHIYTLFWTETELIWYINDLEVFRTAANLPNEPLYLSFNSFISENMSGGEGLLEVDWLKVYSVEN